MIPGFDCIIIHRQKGINPGAGNGNADRDSRVRFEVLGENRGIAGNTNAALAQAQGDFVVLCDHDDLLRQKGVYYGLYTGAFEME